MTGPTDVHPDASVRGLGWSWREPSRGEHFRRCSWCGSVHPEDLATEPSWVPEWADRKYGWPHKFYVDIPNREPDQLFVTQSGSGVSNPPADAVLWADLTPEQLQIIERDHGIYRDNPPDYVCFGTRTSHFGKFYTIHLSDPEVNVAVKVAVERRSGLAFEFVDGRVTWRRAEV